VVAQHCGGLELMGWDLLHAMSVHHLFQSRWAFVPWVRLARCIGVGWNHLLPSLAQGFLLQSCKSRVLDQGPKLAFPRHPVASSSCKDEGVHEETSRGNTHCGPFPV
jgi:hypothetical protein